MKKIDKNYLILCKRLFFLLPKLRKFTSDTMIARCINACCNLEYKDFCDTYYFTFNEKTSKLFDSLNSIVRGLMPYLSDESITQLCGLGGNL